MFGHVLLVTNYITIINPPWTCSPFSSKMLSSFSGCRSWSSRRLTAATLTSPCPSLQRWTTKTTSLVLLSDTTSAARRHPDCVPDVVLLPPVSLRHLFCVNLCTLITSAGTRSFLYGYYLKRTKVPGPCLTSFPYFNSRSEKWPGFYIHIYFFRSTLTTTTVLW